MTVDEAARLICGSLLTGGKVLICGNGGSASQAGHFAAELLGWFENKHRAPLPCIDLCAMAPTLLAIGNDSDFRQVFERQVVAFGNEGDVLIAISTSGESANVNLAAIAAEVRGMDVIALTGGFGGQLALEVNNVLSAPDGLSTAAVQEWHLAALHDIARLVEKRMFPNGA